MPINWNFPEEKPSFNKKMKKFSLLVRRLKDVWYWFRNFFTRYHLVDLRNKDFGYTWGWIDRSEGILLACFAMLKEFVEKEEPYRFHYRDPNGPGPTMKDVYQDQSDEMKQMELEQLQRQHQVGKEIWELYTWWTKTRKEEQDALHALGDEVNATIHWVKEPNSWLMDSRELNQNPKWKEWTRRWDELEEKDQLMLERLIKIRGHLWT